MEKIIKIDSPQEMIELGKKIGELSFPNMLITLNGDLGAGKTTLTKGIAIGMNITSMINSPTFTIMKIHEGDLTLYHLDVYRIDDPESDFELSEYFEADGVCVVEWADNVRTLLPDERIDLQISDLGDNKRSVKFTSYGKVYDSLLSEI